MRQRLPHCGISSLFLLLQVPIVAISQTTLARELVDKTKPSVVRVEAGCTAKYKYTETFKDGTTRETEHPLLSGGLGSGFFINSDGYIVTNAHVVSAVEGGEKGCRERLFYNLVRKITGGEDPDKIAQDRKDRIKANSVEEGVEYYQNVVLFNETGSETFKFDLKKLGTPIGDAKAAEGGNKDIAIIKIGLKNTPALLLEDSNTIQYQDKVTAIGYPGAADMKESLSEASVMDTTVANPNKRLEDKTPVIQLNQIMSPGSSGGPVLNEKGKVVGIVTFNRYNVANEADRITFAVPASVIKEFLSPAGATNQTGTINELYQKGLDLYAQGNYREAKINFDAVKGLFRYHSEIDRLIRDCNQKLAEQSVSPPYLFWGAIGGFTSLVLLSAYFLLRQKPLTRSMAPVGINFPEASSGKRDRKAWGSMSKAASGLFHPTIVSAQHKINLQNVQGKNLNLNLTQPEYRLGRDVSWSNFKFPGEGWGVISRKQAVFRKQGESYYLFDGDGKGTASTNRIYLDETPIPPTGIELKHGMQFRIGNDPSNRVILTYFSSNDNQQNDDRTDVSRK